jgi:DNA-binding FadR family transcriptional regulator
LEAIAARLAADRLTEAELERLRSLVEEMAELTRTMREPQRRVAGVSAFHRTILAGSRNDFLGRFVATLNPFERVHQTEYLDPDEAAAILEEHRGIYDALARRDGEAAQQLMFEHYDRGRAYWRAVDTAEGRRPAGNGRPAAAGTRARKTAARSRGSSGATATR